MTGPWEEALDTLHQFLHFDSSAGWRLVPLDLVVEVIPMCLLDPAQQDEGSKFYRGMLHFRGRVVPVFDLTPQVLDLNRPEWFLLVLRVVEQEVALVAHDVDDILSVPPERLSTLETGGRSVAVVQHGDGLIRVVAPEELLGGSL